VVHILDTKVRLLNVAREEELLSHRFGFICNGGTEERTSGTRNYTVWEEPEPWAGFKLYRKRVESGSLKEYRF
jgi:hypothetical protein